MTIQPETRPDASPGDDTPPAADGRRRTGLVVGGLVAVLAVGSATAVGFGALGGTGQSGTAAPAAGGPLTAPETVGRLTPAPRAEDIGASEGWQGVARKELGDTEFITRQYGTASTRRYVRVVAARTDLTGKLELGWAADAGTTHGDYRCTQNLQPPGTKPGVRKTAMVCWRTSPTLSVYSLAVDLDGTPTPATALPALTAIWEQAARS